MRKTKKLLSVLLSFCLLGGLVGCGNQSNTGSTAGKDNSQGTMAVKQEEKQKLEVWMISMGTKTDAYVDGFKEKYPEVDFKVTWYADDDLKTQSKIAIDSGVVPDIFVGHAGTDFESYYRSGILKDITDLVNKNGFEKRVNSDFFEPYQADKKMYGYPIGGLTTWQTLYINRDLFKQCGITTDPKTIEDLTAVAKTMKDQGVAPLAIGNKDEWPAVILFGDYYAQQAKDYSIVYDIIEGRDKFTENEVIKKAFTTVVDLGKNSVYMPGFSSTDQNTAIQTFAAGQAAMLYCGSWWAGIAGGTDLGFDLDVIALPLMEGVTDNASVQLCSDIALLPTKDCNEEALTKFLDYMTDGGFYTAYSNELNAYAINPDLNDKLEMDPVFKKEPILRQFDKPVLSPFFDWVFPTEVTTELKTSFQMAISGEITVDDALARIQKVMDKNIVTK